MLAGLGVVMMLWLATCFLVIRSKGRSYAWLLLAALGPFGVIGLAGLRDKSPEADDRYQHFMERLGLPLRALYEGVLFVLMWMSAYLTIVWKRDLMILYESSMTGKAVDDIIAEQTASSGMYAFGEGLEMLYVVALFYLLLPICFNALGHLFKSHGVSSAA
jgi:hypothetical protein